MTLALVAVANADVVKGELWFDSKGVGKIRECRTGRIFTLGEMPLERYLRLDEQWWRVSNKGSAYVLVEATGVITGEGRPGPALILESPYVSHMISGRCSQDT